VSGLADKELSQNHEFFFVVGEECYPLIPSAPTKGSTAFPHSALYKWWPHQYFYTAFIAENNLLLSVSMSNNALKEEGGGEDGPDTIGWQ
jgi:hypothetical protein